MRPAAVGFGLGFVVALQLGPMSLFLIRTTLRSGWRVGAAVGAGIATVDGVSILATGTALAGRAAGTRALHIADTVAGVGMIGFGGALALTTVHEH